MNLTMLVEISNMEIINMLCSTGNIREACCPVLLHHCWIAHITAAARQFVKQMQLVKASLSSPRAQANKLIKPSPLRIEL